MSCSFATKLEQFAPLSSQDRRVLGDVSAERVRHLNARQDLVRAGERPHCSNLIVSGWACRYKQMPDGRRQILAFLLPGDLCDLNVLVLRTLDHSIATLTPVTSAQLSPDSLERLVGEHAGIGRALWWETLVNAAIQREWTLSLGQRTAAERIAHLFCELFHRLRCIGLAGPSGFELPATQQDLADATGMTAVHVNRILQELRARKLITLVRRQLHIVDLAALQDLAHFTPTYLHAGSAGKAAAPT